MEKGREDGREQGRVQALDDAMFKSKALRSGYLDTNTLIWLFLPL